MATNTNDMGMAVQEVQTTNRFILKRLNQLVSSAKLTCTCECHDETILKELTARIIELEKKEKETDTIIHEFTKQLKTLKTSVKELQMHSMSRSYESPKIEGKTERDYSELKLLGIKDFELDGKDIVVDDLAKLSSDVSVRNGTPTACEDDFDKSKQHDTETVGDIKGKETTCGSVRPNASDRKVPEIIHVSEKANVTKHSTLGSFVSASGTYDTKSTITTLKPDIEPETDERTVEAEDRTENIHEEDDDGNSFGNKGRVRTHTGGEGKQSLSDIGAASQEDLPKSSVSIVKPNFSNVSQQKEKAPVCSVDSITEDIQMVEAKEKKCYSSTDAWRQIAKEEHDTALATEPELKDLEGAHTVICIDISASMAEGGAWAQVRSFFTSYISGLEDVAIEHGIRDEHVALVTFGHETKVVQRLTNNFSKLRQAFGKLKLGGPTPMFGGLLLTLAATGITESSQVKVNDINVKTKLILVTDGKASECAMYEGPDVIEPGKQDETKSHIISVFDNISESPIDVFCVPVGNPDMEFLQLIQSVCEMTIVKPEDARSLSRRFYLTHKINQGPLGMLGSLLGASDFEIDRQTDLSDSDREQLKDIMDKAKSDMISSFVRYNNEDWYHEKDDAQLPTIGSRVRRGPDWKWNQQDGNGPGTVIGHTPDGLNVCVEWDANNGTNVYRYSNGNYDILIVNEPRTGSNENKPKVGCVVKPGVHFVQGDTKVTEHDRGVVIKVISGEQKVHVRWNNRARGDYSYGENGLHEIELCEGWAMHSYNITSERVPVKRTKNKNKNVF